MVKFIITLGLLFCLPFIIRFLLIRGVTRKPLALLTPLLLGCVNFVISIMYVDEYPLIIGICMFLFAFIGGYPISYFLYPIVQRRMDARSEK